MDSPKKKKPEQVIYHYSGFPIDYKTNEILFTYFTKLAFFRYSALFSAALNISSEICSFVY